MSLTQKKPPTVPEQSRLTISREHSRSIDWQGLGGEAGVSSGAIRVRYRWFGKPSETTVPLTSGGAADE